MYFIPSIQKEIKFKEITIEQFFQILYNNFNKSFIRVLEQNKTENITLTNFDKEILLLQIHLTEIKEISIQNKNAQHPNNEFIIEDIYNIELSVPSLDRELIYYNSILNLNKPNKDTSLLFEISKYITSLTIDNNTFDCKVLPEEFIKTVKEIPPPILAKCVVYIDNLKKQVKAYFKQNNISYKYSIDLLVP